MKQIEKSLIQKLVEKVVTKMYEVNVFFCFNKVKPNKIIRLTRVFNLYELEDV